MTIPTFNPPVAPIVGSTERREIKVNRSEFGDGYTQSTPDGLNHMRRVVTLRWEALDVDDAITIDDFLALQGGTLPFLFVSPGRTDPLRFTCDEWTMTTTTGGYAAIDATFRQSFGFTS